jgi:hypothetical protein
VRKRHFLRHFYINAIILPRQARDKHRENSKKARFVAVIVGNVPNTAPTFDGAGSPMWGGIVVLLPYLLRGIYMQCL